MASAERQLTRKARIAAASAALVALLDKPVRVIPTCGGISKSKFVAGLQCAKRLFLQVHRPHLAKLTNQCHKDQGKAVGLLARNLFPGGVLVDADRNHLAEAVRVTQELVNNYEVPAIFEATFRHNGVLVQVDVLHRSHKKEFRLIEVKSSTTGKGIVEEQFKTSAPRNSQAAGERGKKLHFAERQQTVDNKRSKAPDEG